jgi:hypothetical protein
VAIAEEEPTMQHGSTISSRPLVRVLETSEGRLRCPQRGRIDAAACEACPYLCRDGSVPDSLVCSYPIPASDTFARRRLDRDDVRIALGHRLERT